jgi:hypothetical protein
MSNYCNSCGEYNNGYNYGVGAYNQCRKCHLDEVDRVERRELENIEMEKLKLEIKVLKKQLEEK